MVNKKHIITVLAVLLIAVSAAGCMDVIERDGEYITYTDQTDREVEVVENVESIISISPSNTEVIYELGLGDKVIGVTDWCDYPSEAVETDSVGSYDNPSIETIIDKNPDVVFASSEQEDSIVNQLEKKGISVIVIHPGSYENLLEAIELIANVSGVEENGEALISEIEEQINDVKDKVAEYDERDTLYITWADEPMWVAGQGTYQNDLLELTGANNVIDQEGHIAINYETLVDINPEVMLLTEHAGMTVTELLDESKLEGIDAIDNDEVYVILEDETTRASPRIVDGVNSIVDALYDIELE
ncbi:helical backbone metal receptor [Methanonatronarchaeum sp. AMET-Sl]|uniref:ABC transporter substrate-binding protein n=1 Tax=Methanonatronarchaeum sp. AMET-Sl TaxID=3037654 RepID=UPI00244DFD58|nr:helical backbone metal receptor [Methanonatronarchaeum sp. AMET-Sl]WGI16810.1 helical backbone metal receptor [Methanonatronarchaeum sp. AMET-Sl]